jgi:hypothetical protein
MLDYGFLFLLDGTRIINLLDIPSDNCVLLVSDKEAFKGVEIEDVVANKKHSKVTNGDNQ